MARDAAWLVGVCALTFLAGLGQPALTDSDEAFYAESALEMRERGDWQTPYFNGAPRFDKPVLYYWMVLAAYLPAGPSPGAARLPAALTGVGLVLVVCACARRWYDAPTARLAGLIAATCFGATAMARQALPDLPLAFFVTLTVWTALAGLQPSPPGPDRPRRRRAWLAAAGLAAGGAFLVKGPIGPALAALVVLPIVAIEGRRAGAAPRCRPIDLGLAAAVFAVVAAPWYAAMTIEHGAGYLERFFLAENVERFATPRYNDPRPAWYYLPIVAGGLLPWSPCLIVWGPAIRRAWRRRAVGARTLRLVIWAGAPLLLLTLSVGKQPRYVLPLIAPLAILIARGIRRAVVDDPAGARRLLAAGGAAGGAVIVLFGGLVFRARPLLIEWSDSVIAAAAAAIMLAGAAAAGAALAAWPAGPRAARRARAAPAGLAAAAVVATVCTHAVLLASPGPAPVERMAALVADARAPDGRYGGHRVFDRNLVYYVRTPRVELPVIEAARDFLRLPARTLCVLRAPDAARLRRQGVAFTRLGAVRYLNTGSLTLRTLLDPDPARHVQEIVLVANR